MKKHTLLILAIATLFGCTTTYHEYDITVKVEYSSGLIDTIETSVIVSDFNPYKTDLIRTSTGYRNGITTLYIRDKRVATNIISYKILKNKKIENN